MLGRAMLLGLLAVSVAACGSAGPGPSGSASVPGTPPAGGTPDASSGTDASEIGRAFVEALAAGDTQAAEAMEDPRMRAAAPAAALGTLWQQLVAQFGEYQGLGDVEVTATPPYATASVSTRFAGATVPLLVTVTADGLVAGLHLGEPAATTPTVPSEPPSPAAYVDPDAFTESEVVVGSSPWALPGTLSIPRGQGPFPAVVLVAGSGPQDRDETIGPNAPLRDLAWGLASDGIVVLRYEKRTKAHATAMAALADRITVREEVIDDALAAVDLLRATPGVDPERVFLAGHSLGGYLAPRIAQAAPGRLAGIALLEANASPLDRLIEAQLTYLASPDGGADPQAQAMLDALPAQLALVRSPDLAPTTPASSLPLGIPAAYWLDLRGYDAAATAAGLAIPVFIAQGERDYQVPPSELDVWRAALGNHPDTTIRAYPSLNHLLMAGTGPSRPAEYLVAGHVAPEVVKDLGSWLRAAP